MAELAEQALFEAADLFNQYDEKMAELVIEQEDQLDRYEDALGTYLIKISGRQITETTNKEVALTVECGTKIKFASVTAGDISGDGKRSCVCTTTQGYFDTLDGLWNNGNKYVENNKTNIPSGTFSLVSTWNGANSSINDTLTVLDDSNTFKVVQSGKTATTEILECTVYPSTNNKTVINEPSTLYDNYTTSKALQSELSKTITGVRYMFWGSKSNIDTITSDVVRNLSNGGKDMVGAVSDKTITMGTNENGVNQFIVAIPQNSGYKLTSVKNATAMDDESIKSFKKITVNVEGANGYTSIPYDVYYYNDEKSWGVGGQNNVAFKITISK